MTVLCTLWACSRVAIAYVGTGGRTRSCAHNANLELGDGSQCKCMEFFSAAILTYQE